MPRDERDATSLESVRGSKRRCLFVRPALDAHATAAAVSVDTAAAVARGLRLLVIGKENWVVEIIREARQEEALRGDERAVFRQQIEV